MPILALSSFSRHCDCKAEMLWVDKYRPKTLDNLIVHEDVAQNMKKLVRVFFWYFLFSSCTRYTTICDIGFLFLWAKVTEQDCPHLLFYGPSGSGKKTIITALLRQMFGPSADKVYLFFIFPLSFCILDFWLLRKVQLVYVWSVRICTPRYLKRIINY